MQNLRLLCFGLILAMVSIVPAGAQTRVEVRNTGELKAALENGRPGLIVILSDGSYDFGGDLKIGARGTKKQPLIITGKHRGKATIVGDSRFILAAAEHVVIEGMNFESTNGPAIDLRGSSYVRITRNTFHLKETKRGSWVLIDGLAKDSVHFSHHNRVDHNVFEKKSQLGNFVTIEGTKRPKPQVSQYDRIDHNLFADIGPRVENVLEAIRVGSSEYSLSSGYTVVEKNLFERCDGDPEYISIKSSDDTIRFNTFRQCLGSLSLRHGNRNTVEGNYVLGNNRTGKFLDSTGRTWILGTGGVRFYGTGMRIVNNYFEGLTGKQWDATLAVTSGNAEYGDGQPLTKHFRIHDAIIAFNILVNNTSNLEIGYNGGGFQGNWWHLPPIGMHIENNIIVGDQDTLIRIFAEPVTTVWTKNVVWASEKGVALRNSIQGVQVTEPRLVKTRGIWHLRNRAPQFYPLERSDVGPDAK